MKNLNAEQQAAARIASAKAVNLLKSSRNWPAMLPQRLKGHLSTPHVLRVISETPAKYRGTYIKALHGKSLKTCIRAFCQHCIGYEDVAEAVGVCTNPGCPLWSVRPYQQ